MDCVKVALRIRPLIQTESDSGCRLCIERIPGEPQITLGKGRQFFTFNYVFDEFEGQSNVYNVAVKNLLNNLFKGYNVTILAYGQTGSGKTYTMGTNYDGHGELGVIPRAIIDIFDMISKSYDKDIKVTVSFLELYNESLYDLLTNKPREQSIVEMRECNTGICIPGLTELEVASMEDTLHHLKAGSLGRVTGFTAMNANSSRSHAIFTINIRTATKDNPKDVVKSKFHLVDLAGSERSKKTGTSGDRFKEGVNINKGLLVLGNVIAQLGDGCQYVNYRDSRLTRLLQDSLGGNSMTLMIACVSPADYNQDETLSTLRYADRAKKIKNKPVVNQDPQSAEIARLRKENEELRLQIISGGSVCPPEHRLLEEKLLDSQKKTGKLSEALDQVLKQSTGMFERALLADNWNEKLKKKLDELGRLSESLDERNMDNISDGFVEVKNKINDIKGEHEKVIMQLVSHDKESHLSSSKNSSEVDVNCTTEKFDNPVTPGRENYIFSQAKINKEIEEITRNLVWKEELVNKLSESHSEIVKLQDGSVTQIDALKEQLAALQKEKEELIQQIKIASTGANTTAAKISEQRRKTLQELELKHAHLLKKVTEQEKIIKMKEKSDEKIANLRNEIKAMKQMKVKLIHELRAESNRFKALNSEKDREMYRLRSQNAKKESKLVRMEHLHSLQQNVLKRKLEAAAAANKRIMEALACQKRSEKKLRGSAIERISEMISEELEVLVSAFHAEKSLDSLIQDRATLKKELAIAKENLEDPRLSNNNRRTLEEELKHLQDEMELRSVQISDLQQKILDTQQEDRGKNRWDSLQSMVDAKYALSYLFDMTADLKREIINKDIICNDMKETQDVLLKKQEDNHTKLEEMTSYYKQEYNKLEREYEDKICLLLKQFNNNDEEEVREKCRDHLERIKILTDEVQKIDTLRQDVINLTKRNAELQSQLEGKIQVTSFQDAYEVFLMARDNEDKQFEDENVDTENVLDRTFTRPLKAQKRFFDGEPKQEKSNSDNVKVLSLAELEARKNAEEDDESPDIKRKQLTPKLFFSNTENIDLNKSPEIERKRQCKSPYKGTRNYFY